MIKLAFYKPQDIWGYIIAGWTKIFNWGSPLYCHVEIGFLVDGIWKWYSSASRNWDGTTGTRWIDNDRLFEHPERWDVYNVEPVRPELDMIATCEAEKGKKYDWWGIAGFTTLLGLLNDKNKWYCSEICHYVFFGQWESRVSPEKFYAECKRRFLK